MYQRALKKYVGKQFQKADIHLNGNRPWDLQIHDERFFHKVSRQGSLGMGESFMEGWIDSRHLDESFSRILHAKLGDTKQVSWRLLFNMLSPMLVNHQTKRRSLIVGRKHYDLSYNLFKHMLDKRMVYSCAYWKDAKNLDQAQEAKLDLICKKLYLKPGMRVLDIGCGWGGLAKFAAENYQAQVVGITISQQQLLVAKEVCRGLPVEIRFQDYRDLSGAFDRVVSVGQMEHVGYKNYRTYMKIVNRVLKDDGIFLLHTIGGNISTYSTDPWIEKYIFPNGLIPSAAQLTRAYENVFVMEDWHNFGPDYDKTLMAWFHNFDKNWEILKHEYDEKFYRMWKYYLLTCAAAFRSRHLQLWQIVLSKKGIPGGYTSVR